MNYQDREIIKVCDDLLELIPQVQKRRLQMEGKVERPKSWGELNQDQKIERCREEIKNLQKRLSWDLRRLDKKVELLLQHQHLPSGEVCKKVERFDFSGEDSCGSKISNENLTEIYF